MKRKTALIVCPGRGTYNKDELGYFHRHHEDRLDLIQRYDSSRRALGQTTLTALDTAGRYSINTHTRGDNASALIYACAYADFLAIDRERFDVVAITGNSMGWYIALACAGVLDSINGFEVVNTMGTLMQEALIGGQLLYPFVDENGVEIPGKRDELTRMTSVIPNLYISIELGGAFVFAGDEKALKALQAQLPQIQDRFPMRLHNHAGFHSPLQQLIAEQGLARLPDTLFSMPSIPLIDGRGEAWLPHSTIKANLRDYTLHEQVVTHFDFNTAVRNSVFEFAPEVVVSLGPGNTLGGAIAQCLVRNRCWGLDSKFNFNARQQAEPVLYSMGIDHQRSEVVGSQD